MRVVAYARTDAGSDLAGQIVEAERWAHARGCQIRRLANVPFAATASEFPPLDQLWGACRGGEVDGIVVTGLAALGPDLARSLRQLGKTGARLLIAGRSDNDGWDLGASELSFAADVAHVAVEGSVTFRQRRRRICPPRVRVDIDQVRALQSRGARLCDIAERLNCSRSTLVRRLRKERDRGEPCTP